MPADSSGHGGCAVLAQVDAFHHSQSAGQPLRVARQAAHLHLLHIDPKKDWPNLCRALAHPELIDDARFATPGLRRVNGPGLVALIDATVAAKDLAEWKAIFRTTWRDLVSSAKHAAGGRRSTNGGQRCLCRDRAGIENGRESAHAEGVEKVKPRMAPGVGEHTVEVLQGLGYNERAIADLLNRGVALTEQLANHLRQFKLGRV